MSTLIIGCGETGVRVAARLVAAGDSVMGVVQSEASAQRVRSVGAKALRLDLDALADNPADSLLVHLEACDRLLYFAPPPRRGDMDSRMQSVLTALHAGGHPVPAHVVYISTSGVYGDCGGEWVDETCPLNPESDRAVRRVDAEARITAFAEHAIILRAPGIYGPDRLPIARVLEGGPVLDDEDGGWSNRVHIDDLAAIAYRAATEHWPHRIYNACDGTPTRLSQYYDALAELLGAAPVPRITWQQAEKQFSSMRLSFLRESRRISNQRLLEDTGYPFAFADFRDGLAASLKAEAEPVVDLND